MAVVTHTLRNPRRNRASTIHWRISSSKKSAHLFGVFSMWMPQINSLMLPSMCVFKILAMHPLKELYSSAGLINQNISSPPNSIMSVQSNRARYLQTIQLIYQSLGHIHSTSQQLKLD